VVKIGKRGENFMLGIATDVVSFESVWERAQEIESPHLPKEHGKILFEISQRAPGNCVEIGSWMGRSTALIGSAVRNSGGRLYAIDHWNKIAGGIIQTDMDIWKSWNQTVVDWDLERFVVPLRGLSHEIASGWNFKRHSIGFLFIDGLHSYLETSPLRFPEEWKKEFGMTSWQIGGREVPLEDYAPIFPRGAKLDYDAWAGNIVPGGYLIMHDVNRPEHPGCSKVWSEEVVDSKLWTVIINGDGFGMARKN
jgi:hypothetical protein